MPSNLIVCAGARNLVEQINQRKIEGFQLTTDARPVRPRAGWLYVTVRIVGCDGAASKSPLMTGILSGGGRGVKPWCECRLYPRIDLDGGEPLDARAKGLE